MKTRLSLLLLASLAACDQSAQIGDPPDADPEGCGQPFAQCEVGCVDLSRDRSNCGWCGNACSSLRVCRSGECVDPWAASDAGGGSWDAGTNPWDGGSQPGEDANWTPTFDGGSVDGGLPPANIAAMKPGTLCTSGTPKWCLDAPLPPATALTGVWASSPTDVWITGGGAELHFDGTSWRGTVGGAVRGKLFGTGPNDLWATQPSSSTGLAWWNGTKWQDAYGSSGSWDAAWGNAGSHWVVGGSRILSCGGGYCSTVTSPTANALHGVWGSSANEVWAVGDKGTILFYDGARWAPVTSPTTDDLWAVWGDAAGEAFALTGKLQVLSWKRGSPWATLTGYEQSSAPVSVASAGTGAIWAIQGPRVYRIQGTYPTRTVAFEATASFSQIHSSGPNDAWAVGADGMIAHWDGTRWGMVPGWQSAGSRENYASLRGTSDTDVWALEARGRARRWDGASWGAPVATGIDTYSVALWGAAANDYWVGGTAGQLSHWNGSTWQRAPDLAFLTSKPDITVMWGSSATDIWASGVGGFTARYNGSQWSAQQRTGWGRVYTIAGSGPTDVWMAGEDKVAHRWNGSAWQDFSVPYSPIYAIVSLSRTEAYAFGSAVLLKWNGSQWTHRCDDYGFTASAAWGLLGGTDFWAVSGNGTIHKYSIGSLDLYGNGDCYSIRYQPTSEGLAAVWGYDPAHLWAAGESGSLLRFYP